MGKKHKAEKEKQGKTRPAADKQAKVAMKPQAAQTGLADAADTKLPQASFVDTAEKPSKGLAARQVTLISKALADPTRMAVLRAIAKGGATCSGMRDCAGVSAATLSHHMKELESAGLIEIERKGRFVEPKFQRKVWKRYLEELGSLAK